MSRSGFRNIIFVLIITSMMLLVLIPLGLFQSNSTVCADVFAPAEISGTLYVDTEMRLLFGKGGGTITVTVEGNLASELRRRIDNIYYLTVGSPNRNNSKVDGSINIPSSEVSTFIELLESRLELKQVTNQYDLFYSQRNEYNGIFAGVDISREGGSQGVDIVEVEGLSDFAITSTEDITLHIDFGGSFPSKSKPPKYSNGEIIFYSLFGYFPDSWAQVNETNPNVKCYETISATIVGMGALIFHNKDSGSFSKKRVPGGDVIKFSQNYKLTKTDKTGYAAFEPDNLVQNSIVVSIYGLIICIIMLSLPRSFFKSSIREKKIQWIHWMAIGLFLAILILFFMGIDALSIWIGAPIFAVIVGIASFKFYSKPTGLDTTGAKQLSRTGSAAGANTQWHKLGLKAFERGDLEAALEYFEKALSESIENEIIWNDKGHVLRKLGRNNEALKCFNIALKINPDYDIAQQNKRKTMMDMRRFR